MRVLGRKPELKSRFKQKETESFKRNSVKANQEYGKPKKAQTKAAGS
jgi:hypothetical protein